jgi:hypothetical protein
MVLPEDIKQRHRADYILEQGTWRATCQVCGHFVTDPLRRRAASLFRAHIREATAQIIDLTGGPVERDAQVRI